MQCHRLSVDRIARLQPSGAYGKLVLRGRRYYRRGTRVLRDFFTNALRLMHPNPMARVRMPSAGRISLLCLPEHNRCLLHLTYAPSLQRGCCLVIENLVPLRNVPVEVRLPETIKRVSEIPGTKELPYSESDGKMTVAVPQVRCHQAVVFEY